MITRQQAQHWQQTQSNIAELVADLGGVWHAVSTAVSAGVKRRAR